MEYGPMKPENYTKEDHSDLMGRTEQICDDYPDVLSVKQVAKILGICANSAYRLVNDNTIGTKRVGRKILVPKICLIDYLASARL